MRLIDADELNAWMVRLRGDHDPHQLMYKAADIAADFIDDAPTISCEECRHDTCDIYEVYVFDKPDVTPSDFGCVLFKRRQP